MIDDALLDYEAIERELRELRSGGAPAARPRRGAGRALARRQPAASREPIARTTTILLGGLTLAHDTSGRLARSRASATRSRRSTARTSRRCGFGKEFGNRGQCNPTYFTVGNLVKHLVASARSRGISPTRTSSSATCSSPRARVARAGSARTSPNTARRSPTPGSTASACCCSSSRAASSRRPARPPGLEINAAFFKAAAAGDDGGRLSQPGRLPDPARTRSSRARPTPRSTSASATSATRLEPAEQRRAPRCCGAGASSIAIEVNRLRPKPKVSIIGEFWAMTTEGDGNHRLQRFLEAEGAEVDIQPVTAWVLYNIWEHQHDTRKRDCRCAATTRATSGLKGKDGRKKLALLWAAEKAVRAVFGLYTRTIGLDGYHLARHGRGRDDLAPVLRQPPPRRRRPHGSRQADPDRRSTARRTW